MSIVKRKDYYYLGHSFRVKNKVKYREKYLGKKIPENMEGIEEGFIHECLEDYVFKKLNNIKKNFSKEWKKYPESIKKEILVDFSIDFTYNTNAIEGSTVTLEETEDLIKRKIAPNKPLSDVKETMNHSEVFFNALNDKNELSLRMIIRWHKELFFDTKPDIAGKIRNYLVRVGDYIAPDWQNLEGLLKDFFGWYSKNKNKLHPVELAARSHYKFEMIHPFGDGNGRIGRLIIAYILKRKKFPILIIEYKKRRAYYKALSKPEDKFVQYFIRRYINAHKKYVG